jgi:hypothetical protein
LKQALTWKIYKIINRLAPFPPFDKLRAGLGSAALSLSKR